MSRSQLRRQAQAAGNETANAGQAPALASLACLQALDLISKLPPGPGRQRRASEPELNENSNPVPVPKEMTRI